MGRGCQLTLVQFKVAKVPTGALVTYAKDPADSGLGDDRESRSRRVTLRSARAGAEVESPPAGGGSCVFEVACGTMTRRRGSEVRIRLPGPLGATGPGRRGRSRRRCHHDGRGRRRRGVSSFRRVGTIPGPPPGSSVSSLIFSGPRGSRTEENLGKVNLPRRPQSPMSLRAPTRSSFAEIVASLNWISTSKAYRRPFTSYF